MQPLTNIHALIIDMDGVLWEGTRALPGLIDFFTRLRDLQLPFILATNNASLTQQQYISKLEKMGVSVSANEILTSSMATAHHLSGITDPNSTRLFVIGEEGLRRPLIEKGFTLVDSFQSNEDAVDFVVSGLDRKVTWEILADASLHLGAGAKFIATNADTSLPTERGNVLGNGAILAALQAATQIAPTIIGKPEAIMYQQVIKQLGIAADKTVAIGDRLNTDILGAVNTGIRSIMVLSGISSESDLETLDYRPTWIMPDIQAITEALPLKND
ncbi:MAG: HAD-IIA family hydrolase [Methylococcaceae bacterium]